MARQRYGGRTYSFWGDDDETPEWIEKHWHRELLQHASLKASNPERIALLELLQDVEATRAEAIYLAAIQLMAATRDVTIALAEPLRTLAATPDEEGDAGAFGKIQELLAASDRIGVSAENVWAMIDPKSINWYHRRTWQLDSAIFGHEAPKRGPARQGPKRDDLPAEMVLSDVERKRLAFLRWRLTQESEMA